VQVNNPAIHKHNFKTNTMQTLLIILENKRYGFDRLIKRKLTIKGNVYSKKRADHSESMKVYEELKKK
jgi:hypothetical protein